MEPFSTFCLAGLVFLSLPLPLFASAALGACPSARPSLMPWAWGNSFVGAVAGLLIIATPLPPWIGLARRHFLPGLRDANGPLPRTSRRHQCKPNHSGPVTQRERPRAEQTVALHGAGRGGCLALAARCTMGAWRKVNRPCPKCGSSSLEETMFSWYGRAPDGCPTGGIAFPVRCTACHAKFVRLDGEELLSPEVAGERELARQERAHRVWKESKDEPEEAPQMSDAEVLEKLIAEGIIRREEL